MQADAGSMVHPTALDPRQRPTATGGPDAAPHPVPDWYMTDEAPIRILLVDDHTILREGLASVLTTKGGFEVVGQAGEEVFRGLRAGAASYLLKDVDSSVLISTIRTVHTGRKAISPEIAAKLADHVASDQLTARQQEVLNCLAEGKSNLEIAHTLFISEGTVKAHVKAILQKLEARDRTQAITIAIRRGMVRTL